MIKIKADLNFDVQKIEYPLKMVNENICLHCGSSDTLKTVNIFGKPDPTGIKPFSHIKCTYCGRIYSIQWTKVEEDRMVPVAVSPSAKQEFLNCMNIFKNKDDKDNIMS